MTFTEAAAQVLRLVGKPLHYKEITDVAIERNLLSHVGKSPEVTMGARLAALVKKADKDNPLVRVKPGVFALREWDKKTIDKGLKDRTPAIELATRAAESEAQAGDGANGSSVEIASAPLASAPLGSAPAASEPQASASGGEIPDMPDGDEERVVDEAERERAAIAASAADLFEAEDDDDVPILQAPPARADSSEDGDEDGDREGGARRGRRRRRRRGRDKDRSEERADGGMPGYTVSDAAFEDNVDAKLDALRDDTGPLEDLTGKPLADALERMLSGQDRNNGTTSTQRLAEAACRKGRGSEASFLAAAMLAAARADNLRRGAESRRLRFRISGQRVGLTEWAMDGELLRIEKDLEQLVARHREASRKLLARKISDLPQRALSELIITLLERVGVSGLSPVKRTGVPNSELHLSGVTVGAGAGVPTAIVVRRDGREIGRERVLELRGALHHYGPAAVGMLITTGQALSGAREEAQASGAAPVTLVDGVTLAKWCESHGVGVTNHVVRLGVPDLELFDALRSG